MHINFQMIVLFGMTAVSCLLGNSILRGKLRGKGAKTVGIMMFIGSAWMFSSAMEMLCTSIPAKRFWDIFQWTTCILLPPSWLIFVLQFSGSEHLISKRNLMMMGILALVFFLLLITNTEHGLFWSKAVIDEDGINLDLVKTFGPLYWVFEIYAFAIIFLGVYLSIQMLVRSSDVYRYQASMILVASLVPAIGVVLSGFDIFSFTRFDIGPIATGIATWIVAWNVFRFRLVDTMRLARDTVLERMSHGVIVLYAENEVVYLNSIAEDLIGRKADEVVGSRIDAIWEAWPGGCESFDLKEEVTKEITIGAGDAEQTHELRISPLLDWRNRLVGQVILTLDITERIHAARVLQKYTDELKRSNLELERFAYIASHDLREPLRTISSYTQLLARRYQGQLDSDADEFISFAVEGANRMQQLIDDLLEYSRVGTRGKPFVQTDTSDLLQRVLKTLHASIEESQAKISYNGMPTLMADTTQLGQLFQNLIGNAIKFRSDRPLDIQIDSELEGEDWHFIISDNGIGIDEKYFNKIFQIFQRLHSREKYPGTGIGLALCKRIVDRHGGRIWVESKAGVGSSFHFTLPEKGILEG
jgi:signal transduction histidine kinase